MINAGRKLVVIPGGGMRVAQPAAAAIIPWYLSGGVSAANCIAAYQPKGAADLAASYVNLASPGTYNAAPGNAPNFNAATGWAFDGANDWLGTGIAGNNAYSWVIRYSGASADTGAAFGMTYNNVRINFYPKYTDNQQYFRAAGNYNRSAPADFAAGVAAASPATAYWNGAPLGSVTGDLTGTTAATITIGFENTGNIASPPASALWPGNVLALAIYSVTISDAQVLAISTAMAAL